MTNYKILFLDIDGTILRPDDTIEESTKIAVKEMKNQNIEVVLATGRPIHEISDIGRELSISSFIGYNGALAIYDGETIFAEPMERKDVQYILDVARENGHEVVLYTASKNYLTVLDSELMLKFLKQFHLRKNELLTDEVMDDILGMTIITTGNLGHEHYKFNDSIHLSQVNIEGMQHCYDVIRDKVNKGVGVKFLLERLGIEKENSIAFGDGMNDKEMLSYVGAGFAMGNGHPDLFQYAPYKTTEVTNSGVFNGLKTLGLLN